MQCFYLRIASLQFFCNTFSFPISYLKLLLTYLPLLACQAIMIPWLVSPLCRDIRHNCSTVWKADSSWLWSKCNYTIHSVDLLIWPGEVRLSSLHTDCATHCSHSDSLVAVNKWTSSVESVRVRKCPDGPIVPGDGQSGGEGGHLGQDVGRAPNPGDSVWGVGWQDQGNSIYYCFL